MPATKKSIELEKQLTELRERQAKAERVQQAAKELSLIHI